MRRGLLAAALLLSLAVPAAAQDGAIRDALRWHAQEHAADLISTALVAAAIAAPCLIDRSVACVEHEAVRVGLAVGVGSLVKRVVHRPRPDGSDNKSYYSLHTSITCAATLRTAAWALCPAVGYLRIAADKHWASDVGSGAAIGALLSIVW